METVNDDIMTEKSFLPFKMNNLTTEMAKQAEEELDETEENRIKCLKELRELIAEEKNLDIWTDDSYLLQFLRVRKFDPQKAMELLRNFYSTKRDFPEVYFLNWDLALIKSFYEENAGGVFPYRHKDGGTVFFIKISNWEPAKYSGELAIFLLTAFVLFIAENIGTQVYGSYIVFDAGYAFKHVRAITMSHLRLFSRGLKNNLPIRFKEIHVVNESAGFRYLFNIIKMFLSDKIKKRIQCHGSNMKQLHKYIPKEILSSDYGGDIKNYIPSEFCRKDFDAFFEKYCKLLLKGYS